jgi:hypothetical protein
MVELLGSNILSLSQKHQTIIAQTSKRLRQNFLDTHNNRQQEYLQIIQKDKPFSSRDPQINYEEIKYIVPIDYTQSITGEVFRIEMNDGRKYKLRKCRGFGPEDSGEQRAQGIDENISGLEEILPPYYGREKEYLLFDRVDGMKSIFEYHYDDAYQKVWAMIAKIHAKIPLKENKKVFDRWLKKRTNYESMAPYFTDKELNIIKQKVATWLENPQIVFWLDLWDFTTGNIKFTSEGNPIIIDEESISYSIKGIGLGKLMRWKWYDQEKVQSGYQSIKPSEYIFSPEFLDFVSLLMLLNSLRFRIANHEEIDSILQEIKDRL